MIILSDKRILILEPLVLEDSSQFFLPEHPGEPQFAEGVETNTNVTGQLGGTVFLHCPVVNSGDRAVSYPSVSTSILTWHAHKAYSSFFFNNFICSSSFLLRKFVFCVVYYILQSALTMIDVEIMKG